MLTAKPPMGALYPWGRRLAQVGLAGLLGASVALAGCPGEGERGPSPSPGAEGAASGAAALGASAATGANTPVSSGSSRSEVASSLAAKPEGQATASPSLAQRAALAPPRSPQAKKAVKGLYLTATGVALPRFEQLMDRLKAAGGNAIVFDAKDEGGIVSYPSAVGVAKAVGAFKEGPIADLKAKIAVAHARGIHVAGRIVCFHDPIVAKAHPEWCVKDGRTGQPWKEAGGVGWLDPSKPEVQAYVIALADELASAGADEVQFDYIRFPAQGDTSQARFAFDPKKKPKHEVITAFLREASAAVRRHGAVSSVDVYGIMAWAREVDERITGQRLEDMALEADVICPMVYPSHFGPGFAGVPNPADQPYRFVKEGVGRLKRKVAGSGVTLRPWLQAMPWKVSRFTPQYVADQIRASNEQGGTGWMLWNAQNLYDVGLAGAAMVEKAKR